MSTHTIVAEMEQQIVLGGVVSMTFRPRVEITFDYNPAPGLLLEFRKAKLLDGDGFSPNYKTLRQWASDWLLRGPGFAYAVDCARLDLDAMQKAN